MGMCHSAVTAVTAWFVNKACSSKHHTDEYDILSVDLCLWDRLSEQTMLVGFEQLTSLWELSHGQFPPLKEDEIEELEGGEPNFDAKKDEDLEALEDKPAEPVPHPDGIFEDSEEEKEDEAEDVKAPEGEAEVQEKEQKKEVGKEEKEVEWETRVFRMATPMYSKKAKEVTGVVMDLLLRLRADGYHVGHIHSDQGHEFQVWCRERGIHLTRTLYR